MKNLPNIMERAKTIHKIEAPKGSYYGMHFPKFAQYKKDELSTKGKVDPEKVYKSLGLEEQQFTLVRRIIEVELSEEEVLKTIEARFRNIYGPDDIYSKMNPEGTRDLINRHYPEWCEYFGIKPNTDFPDWINKE